MEGLPVTIRLLDPPLHEFLPTIEELLSDITRLKDFSQIMSALEQLPGTAMMIDPEMYKLMPSIETMTREFSELRPRSWTRRC